METFERGSVHPTAVVSSKAELGADVTVGAFTVVHDGVRIGDRGVIGSHCVLGEPAGSFYRDDAEVVPTVLGDDALVRSHSIIYEGATTGSNLRAGNAVQLREGCRIGEDVQIGANAEIRELVTIGDHCRLQSGVGLAPSTLVEEFVWIFPWTMAVDDPHPPSDTCTRPPTIRRYAVIASNSLLLPGVEIGEHAFVGAMSMVNRDVPPEAVVVGNPAKVVGNIRDLTCKHGELDAVYPWPRQFRRGFPEGALPPVEAFT